MAHEPSLVPNPLKAELTEALRRARLLAEEYASVLDGVHRALRAGAWQSRMGDDFAVQARQADRDGAGAVDDCVSALRRALAVTPDEVELGYWRYRPTAG